MKQYTNIEFYSESYLNGRDLKIPAKEFDYWAMLASAMIRRSTFGNIDGLDGIPDEVQMCCCEVSEKLYAAESVKGENGMILQSYGNDGETGTFKADELSENEVQKSISRIIRKWLGHTGLMYCGVM